MATVQLKGGSAFLGTINVRATTTLDRADRMVVLTDMALPAMRFVTDAAGIVPIGSALSAAFAGATLRVPLDDLLATMSPSAFAQPPAELTSRAAVEVLLEKLVPPQGAQFLPIVAQRLDGCINSTAPLFRTDAGVCYLLVAAQWYSSDALQSGAWQWVAPSTLPEALRAIPESSQWASALAHVPATPQAREAAQIAAFSPPPALAAESLAANSLEVWWNPWDGSWWSGAESAQARAARTGVAANAAPSTFDFDPASENLFVGLDGRIYAHRGAQWFRTAPGGGWVELTENRSTARVLEDFARARAAALARRSAYEKWRGAQSARDLSDPTTASQERLSMKDAHPTSVGMRHANAVAP